MKTLKNQLLFLKLLYKTTTTTKPCNPNSSMAGFNQLRNTITSKFCLRNGALITRYLPSVMRDSARFFSAELGQQQAQLSSPESFGHIPSAGATYVKVRGSNKYTLKTDIINFFDGCNLTLDDVKFEYNRAFMPMGFVVQFASRSAFDQAFRINTRKGRPYFFDMTHSAHWDALPSYNGKVVVLQGLPRNAVPEDVDRLLSGCDYDPSSMEIYTSFRPGTKDLIRMAAIRFASQAQAMSACIAKNRDFCLNNQILVRVVR